MMIPLSSLSSLVLAACGRGKGSGGSGKRAGGWNRGGGAGGKDSSKGGWEGSGEIYGCLRNPILFGDLRLFRDPHSVAAPSFGQMGRQYR